MTDFKTLTLATDDHGIATVTINRPDVLNALNADVLNDLIAVANKLHDDKSIRVMILTGEGRAFVAGADISAMSQMSEAKADEFGRLGHQAMDAIEALPFPTIAAVNGFALGGGLELALTCDLIYLSQKAKVGLPEVGLGIIPGFGGTQRLGRRIGWQQARRLVFTGTTIGADEAKAIGIGIEIFSPENFLEDIQTIAREITKKGPIAVRAAKAVMRKGSELPLEQANKEEVAAFAGLWDTEDRQEGMAAFMEKRVANFKGA